MWLRRLALGIALLAAVLLLASGPGLRLGLWPLRTAFELMRFAAYLGIAATALAAVALCIPRVRRGGVAALAAAFLVGAASAAGPLEFQRRARSVPPIHDISTDTASPPEFVALLPLRAGARNPPAYAGPESAKLQRAAYPDLAPILLAEPPEKAFARAVAAAEAMGWEIVAREPAAGRIEAVATTFWFGFKDDVVVRVAPAGGGSRIDVRSKSRVGRSDAGTNARRIRGWRAALLD